ncbi:MAG: L-serine ammonia-lyase [Alphaproteobacteria bacterium]|nr:L-serine ammonia-lyase [Alphaproteobacteria bacterium]
MFISVSDLFKIGIGPSSSHTMGPMMAALRFLDRLRHDSVQADNLRVQVTFYGSLAFTGKGHASDVAVMLGLLGLHPATFNPDDKEKVLNDLKEAKYIQPEGLPKIAFDPGNDVLFDYGDPLPGHPNGMTFKLTDKDGNIVTQRSYFSIGGGFVLSEEEMAGEDLTTVLKESDSKVPYPFANAKQMLAMAKESGLSIAEMKAKNEIAVFSEEEMYQKMDSIWKAMNDCLERGLAKKGILPGELKVKRRAANIKEQLDEEVLKNSQTLHVCNEWLSLYAMAVNEENAAGGQVVTAPTNGAAGVIPAVLRYYLDFVAGAEKKDIYTFLLTAAAIGGIIKYNASISGAEVGCQGEVGSASAMAAAGLCAVMGGTAMQIENAAEIALEHHLGMTCDPVAGLVQIPCIERNGLGAVKAVTASALSLRGDGTHFISLDSCIKTMLQTGRDMQTIYKETSQGGLAVNYIEC